MSTNRSSLWNESDFQALEQDIANVRTARTAGEADRAASRTVPHFSSDRSDRRTELVARLNALWDGGAIYNVSSDPQLTEFKQLLVAWLENILMSRKTSRLLEPD